MNCRPIMKYATPVSILSVPSIQLGLLPLRHGKLRIAGRNGIPNVFDQEQLLGQL